MEFKFTAVEHGGKFTGEKFETGRCVVFFGSRHATWEVLPNLFPELKFAKLKQIHGNNVVCSPTPELTEADGHWTEQNNTALTIVTADCLPIMIVDSNRIGAVHAGWRGIENQVLLKTLQAGFSRDLEIFIGPHIHRDSFEVGNDVAEKFVASAVFPHPDPQKKYVDLAKITLAQLQSFGVDENNVYLSPHNTFKNLDFSSYRRKEKPTGRNISFIFLKPS
jgi:polyphenol oxidase